MRWLSIISDTFLFLCLVSVIASTVCSAKAQTLEHAKHEDRLVLIRSAEQLMAFVAAFFDSPEMSDESQPQRCADVRPKKPDDRDQLLIVYESPAVIGSFDVKNNRFPITLYNHAIYSSHESGFCISMPPSDETISPENLPQRCIQDRVYIEFISAEEALSWHGQTASDSLKTIILARAGMTWTHKGKGGMNPYGCSRGIRPVVEGWILLDMHDEVLLQSQLTPRITDAFTQQALSQWLQTASEEDKALKPAQLYRVINKGRRQLQLCYESALREDASADLIRFDGPLRLEVDISIGKTGDVTALSLRGELLENMASCVSKVVHLWKFPVAEGITEVSFPVVFKPISGFSSL